MPRGNDTQGQELALHELADSMAVGTAGGAEELIRANNALRTADLATIGSFPVDDEATAELDLDSLSGPNDEYVVDAVVRGSGRTKGTIVVFEDETGRLHKHLAESNLEEVRGRGEGAREASDGPRRSARAKTREGEKAAEPDKS